MPLLTPDAVAYQLRTAQERAATELATANLPTWSQGFHAGLELAYRHSAQWIENFLITPNTTENSHE